MASGDPSRALRAREFLLAIGVAVILGAALPSIQGRALTAQPSAPKHVLLLYSHESALYTQFEAPLRSALATERAHPVNFYTEYLDLIRFPRERYEQQLVNLLRVKYADRRIDLIVVVSSLAFDLVRARGDELFPGIPIVFASVNAARIDNRLLPSHITGVAVSRDYRHTLNIALDLHPDTERVFIPAGSSPAERAWVASTRQQFEAYGNRVAFTYLSELPISEIVRRLQHLPPRSLVFFSPLLYSDSNGAYFRPEQLAGVVAAAANAPVYGTEAPFLGAGIVGGSLFDLTAVGAAAGEMGQRILSGESPARIPVRTINPNRNMFDARQLARWGIAEQRLPPGSVVMHRTPTLWNQHYGYVVATGLALAGQTVLLAMLLVQRARRRRVERALRASEAAVRASETAARASYAEVQALVGRLITAQESERRRIARDLHDDLSQKLAALGIEFGRLVSRPAAPAALEDAFRELGDRVATIAGDVHRLSHDLHPARLEIIGLVPALDGLCREMSLQHDIDVEFRHRMRGHRLPPGASLCLFRIAQEALHNVVKHSGARTAKVRLIRTRSGVRLDIADRGRGFDHRLRSGDGLGLLSMRERVIFAGGTIAIRSVPERGTHIVASLPVGAEASDWQTDREQVRTA
jgi:signal transduction histidine kinase